MCFIIREHWQWKSEHKIKTFWKWCLSCTIQTQCCGASRRELFSSSWWVSLHAHELSSHCLWFISGWPYPEGILCSPTQSYGFNTALNSLFLLLGRRLQCACCCSYRNERVHGKETKYNYISGIQWHVMMLLHPVQIWINVVDVRIA